MVMNAETGLHRPHDNRGTGGRTHAGGRIETVKANAVGSELIKVGCFDDGIAITTEPATDILQINPENIRAIRGVGGKTNEAKEKGKDAFHGCAKNDTDTRSSQVKQTLDGDEIYRLNR